MHNNEPLVLTTSHRYQMPPDKQKRTNQRLQSILKAAAQPAEHLRLNALSHHPAMQQCQVNSAIIVVIDDHAVIMITMPDASSTLLQMHNSNNPYTRQAAACMPLSTSSSPPCAPSPGTFLQR
jgi:hypothetical protein